MFKYKEEVTVQLTSWFNFLYITMKSMKSPSGCMKELG